MGIFIPNAGDVVWLNFSPQTGHEQAGHRPAVVISPYVYNKTGLMLCCPVTTKIKGYPFEVELGGTPKNVALSDQIKSLDWRMRRAKWKAKISDQKLDEIRAKSIVLIEGLSQNKKSHP